MLYIYIALMFNWIIILYDLHNFKFEIIYVNMISIV